MKNDSQNHITDLWNFSHNPHENLWPKVFLFSSPFHVEIFSARVSFYGFIFARNFSSFSPSENSFRFLPSSYGKDIRINSKTRFMAKSIVFVRQKIKGRGETITKVLMTMITNCLNYGGWYCELGTCQELSRIKAKSNFPL